MNYFCSIFCFLILGWTSLVPEFSFAARSEKMSGEKTPEDASDITWAHAVNSRDALEQYLASSVNFLEADVSLGHVIGKAGVIPIPVMSHPPSKISDISLDQWLDTVTSRGSDKGIKLDFKSTEVVEPSLIILKRYASKLKGALWLSGDVIPGPGHPSITPVQADLFVAQCTQHFPNTSLSLGWATKWSRNDPVSYWHYQWQHVREMADTVRCQAGNEYPSISFGVRAVFVSRSVEQLRWLLSVIPRSTLTVWHQNGDAVSSEDMLRIQQAFPRSRVYYDVPETLKPSGKHKNVVGDKKKHFSEDEWLSVHRGSENICESHTYAEKNRVMLGKSLDVLVIHRDLFSVDGRKSFTFTGRIKFFTGEDIMNPTHWEHKLGIILIDVNRLPKAVVSFSKKKMAFGVESVDALWTAVNSSVLYTFGHQYFQGSTTCRMFTLDLGTSLLFKAWTTPCDEMFEHGSLEQVAKASIPEIELEEQISKKGGTYIIGFHSYGEEYILLHSLEVVIRKT